MNICIDTCGYKLCIFAVNMRLIMDVKGYGIKMVPGHRGRLNIGLKMAE